MTHATLFDSPLEARWRAFHEANPRVWELFEHFALDAVNSGRGRFGARLIWERMRWYVRFETTETGWKLNDHHPPYYARHFLRKYPEHAGLFELRRVQGEVA